MTSIRQLQTILDHLEAYVFTKDLHGRYTYANRKTCDLLGCAVDDIVGATDEKFFAPVQAARLFVGDRRAIEQGERVESEEVLDIGPAIGPRIFWNVKLPLRDADGAIVGLCGIATDITERKKAEDAIRKSEQSLNEAQSIAHIGSWSWDVDSDEVRWSRELFEITGRDPLASPPVYADFAPLYTTDSLDLLRHAVAEAVRVGTPYAIELDMRRLDGQVRRTLTRGRPVVDLAGRVTGLHGIVQDITEARQAEEELNRYRSDLEDLVCQRTAELMQAKQAAESANLAKTRFLAAASHDLRQPMLAINLFHDALDNTGLNAEQQKISDQIGLSIQALGDLLNALLDISRLDAGAIRPMPGVVRVDALFGKLDAEFSSVAQARALRFKLCFPFGDMAIVTDERLLMSLLGNLVGNAIRYTAQGGVLVGIRRRGARALIQVWDTGIGIASEHGEEIFEEYFQVDNPQRDRRKGLGLGLSIARRIAGLLGTEVVCRSRLGKGSVFEVALPLASDARLPAATAPCRTVAGGLAGRRIVVVEDDAMAAGAIRIALESVGMRVRQYDSAEAALADPESASADFCITDFRLPGIDGVEFLDRLQQRAAAPLKALILTGCTALSGYDRPPPARWKIAFKPVDLTTLIDEIAAQDAREVSMTEGMSMS